MAKGHSKFRYLLLLAFAAFLAVPVPGRAECEDVLPPSAKMLWENLDRATELSQAGPLRAQLIARATNPQELKEALFKQTPLERKMFTEKGAGVFMRIKYDGELRDGIVQGIKNWSQNRQMSFFPVIDLIARYGERRGLGATGILDQRMWRVLVGTIRTERELQLYKDVGGKGVVFANDMALELKAIELKIGRRGS